MRHVIGFSLAALAFASPSRAATQEEREGWYLVKVIPGGSVTVTQHPTTAYGCGVQASIARRTVPDLLAECVYLQPTD